MKKTIWPEEITIEDVRQRWGKKKMLPNNILYRIANWIGCIVKSNCLLLDTLEEQMTEVNGVRRRTQKKILRS